MQIFELAGLMVYFIIRFSNLIPQKYEIGNKQIANHIVQVQAVPWELPAN